MRKFKVPVRCVLEVEIHNESAYLAEADALLAVAAFEGKTFKLAARADGPRARLVFKAAPDGAAEVCSENS